MSETFLNHHFFHLVEKLMKSYSLRSDGDFDSSLKLTDLTKRISVFSKKHLLKLVVIAKYLQVVLKSFVSDDRLQIDTDFLVLETFAELSSVSRRDAQINIYRC